MVTIIKKLIINIKNFHEEIINKDDNKIIYNSSSENKSPIPNPQLKK